MHIPEELRYTKDHEWIKVENDIAIEGITDYAQNELSDIVYVELPKVGTKVEKGNAIGTIEAVKAVVDLYAGISGEIIEVNPELKTNAGIVNHSPYEDGWMVKIKMSNPDNLNELLSAEAYKKLLEEEH